MWFTRSGTGTTPVSIRATPTPLPLYWELASWTRVAAFHIVFGAHVSNWPMFTLAMWIRPSPHTRHTSGEEARRHTADPGTVAENPPTMGGPAVTCPPPRRPSA